MATNGPASPRAAPRPPQRNPGWFRKGFDPRRHILTHEERVRGGRTAAKRMLIEGRWPLNWLDFYQRKEHVDDPQEQSSAVNHAAATGT